MMVRAEDGVRTTFFRMGDAGAIPDEVRVESRPERPQASGGRRPLKPAARQAAHPAEGAQSVERSPTPAEPGGSIVSLAPVGRRRGGGSDRLPC